MTIEERIDEMTNKPIEEQTTYIWQDISYLQDRVDSLVKQMQQVRKLELMLLKAMSEYANEGGIGFGSSLLPRRDAALCSTVKGLMQQCKEEK